MSKMMKSLENSAYACKFPKQVRYQPALHPETNKSAVSLTLFGARCKRRYPEKGNKATIWEVRAHRSPKNPPKNVPPSFTLIGGVA